MSPDRLRLRNAALDRVAERQVLKAKAFAEEMRELAGLDALYDGDADVLLELAGTARIGQARSAGQLTRASRLVELFPVAMELLEAGEMYVATAELLLALTKNASDRVQHEVDRRISRRVASFDAVDARARIAHAVVQVESEIEAEEAEQRRARARANRGVWVKPVEDGMARIGAEVDGIAARKFELAFEEIVRAQKIRDDRDGIKRTQAQRRADVLAELPARYIALLTALQRGEVEQLLALARAEAATALAAESSAPQELTQDEVLVGLLAVRVRQPVMLNVHSAATTLFGLDDRPCTVEGLGPWPGVEARMLLPDAALRRVLVDPETGIPIHVGQPLEPVVFYEPPPHRRRHPPPEDGPPLASSDPPSQPPSTSPESSSPVAAGSTDDAAEKAAREKAQAIALRDRLVRLVQDLALLPEPETQYVPSARLRRLVQLRDQRCSGPGCSRSATACDLDHGVTYAEGGLTADVNLDAKSRRCHGARHDGWTVVRDARTGMTTWTSPLGRTYTRLPAWEQLPAVRRDARLPLPRLERRRDADRDFPDDRPLVLDESTEPRRAETRGPAVRRSDGAGWDDGAPPPF